MVAGGDGGGVCLGHAVARGVVWADPALTYLLRGNPRSFLKRLAVTPVLGLISGLGLASYMLFLYQEFGDPLAFMHAHATGTSGISLDRIRFALNPTNAMAHRVGDSFFSKANRLAAVVGSVVSDLAADCVAGGGVAVFVI